MTVSTHKLNASPRENNCSMIDKEGKKFEAIRVEELRALVG